MIEGHAGAERGRLGGGGLAAVARGFLNQPGFVEQLVTLEHFLLVPGHAFEAEAQPRSLAALFGEV